MAKYDIYISYSRKDGKQYACLLQLILEKKGYRVYLVCNDLACGGANGLPIKESSVFMVILTKEAMASCVGDNSYIEKEIEMALQENKRIVPINPDNTFGGIHDGVSPIIKHVLEGFQLSEIDFGSNLEASVDRMVRTRIEPYCYRGMDLMVCPLPSPVCAPACPGVGAANNSAPRSIGRATTYSPGKSSIDSETFDVVTSNTTRSLIGKISNLLFGGLRNALCGSSMACCNADYSSDTDKQETPHSVDACVYAPAEVCLKKSFIIRVYMYLPHEKDEVDSKIKEIDSAAVKKEYKSLDLPVKEGDKLTVRLDLPEGVQCKTTTKSVIWRNHYTDCSFIAKLVDADLDSIEGTAHVFVNDIPAGEMLFIIDVVESQPRELYTEVVSRRFSKIFISYSHRDANQVKGFAECCRMLGTDYFFDRHTLKPGDIFKEKILEYINGADLFVLCWSKNAAESEWVQIEREHALQLIQEGKSSLSIYPLCLQPVAPLPIDMADKYNFGTL